MRDFKDKGAEGLRKTQNRRKSGRRIRGGLKWPIAMPCCSLSTGSPLEPPFTRRTKTERCCVKTSRSARERRRCGSSGLLRLVEDDTTTLRIFGVDGCSEGNG